MRKHLFTCLKTAREYTAYSVAMVTAARILTTIVNMSRRHGTVR